MSVHLIVNPAAGAGGARGRAGDVRDRLSRDVAVEMHTPDSADAAGQLMRGLASSGVERVVVLGGDGMAHIAANALVGSETVLGLISGGTGNDTVTSLGLPKRLDAACAAALADASPIDLIESEAGVALTVAIVGFAVAVNERAEEMVFPKGAAKYTVATMVELPRLRSHPLTITVDGMTHDVAPNLLAVANMAYFGGGMRVAPDADAQDGQLDVVIMGPTSHSRFAGLLPTVFSGRHVRSSAVTVLRGSEVTIEGGDLAMRADGEPWGHLPATLRARPNALHIAGV